MRNKKVIIWITSLVGVTLVSLIGFVLLCFANNHITRREMFVRSYFWGNRKFDTEAWKRFSPTNDAATIEQQDMRGQMVFSLLRTYQVIGMTREQITALLGLPDWGGNGYLIGNHTALRIDPDVFYVTFDAMGRVGDFRVEQK